MRGQRRRSAGADLQSHVASARDPRLERLIDSLPQHFRSTIRLLRQRSSPWLRMTAGVLLVCGGLLGFLPIMGFWMLPLGLVLLADDVSSELPNYRCWPVTNNATTVDAFASQSGPNYPSPLMVSTWLAGVPRQGSTSGEGLHR